MKRRINEEENIQAVNKARSELQAARAKIVAAKQSGNSGKGMYSKR